MKIGAAFLISIASAQDYGLDGADVNVAAFDSDYNYDEQRLRPEKEEQNASITLDDLSSLLADYYGSETDYSLDDYNSALNELQAELGTTAQSFTTEAFDFGGRPDADDYDGTDGDEGKQFQNFQTSGNLEASQLVLNSQTFCWVCDATGDTTQSTLDACQNTGSSQDCLKQGEGDYCQVSIRTFNGVIKQMQSRCAQADTCDSIDNFQDTAANPKPSRYDRCIPQTWLGRSWGANPRMANRESTCSICHYTTTDSYASGPAAVSDDGTTYPNLLITNTGDIKITGATAGKTMTLTHGDFDQEWGTQTNNVLDTN